jgi:hypothetical protein
MPTLSPTHRLVHAEEAGFVSIVEDIGQEVLSDLDKALTRHQQQVRCVGQMEASWRSVVWNWTDGWKS